MRRTLLVCLTPLFLCSCATPNLADLQHNLTAAAGQKLQQMMAAKFSRRFGSAIDSVVDGLAHAGGYLENPLVRVLLPPPMGLVLGVVQVVQDVHENPEAVLLERLMNQAAESAIPNAGPVLQAALASITTGEMETVLGAGRYAATEMLETRARATLQDALAPAILSTLADTGANHVYAKMLDLHALKTEIETGTLPVEPEQDLGAYVTQRAVDGLFKALAQEEGHLRDQLASTAQWQPVEWVRGSLGTTGS